MKSDSGRHAERGDAKQAPSEGCQSGAESASPEHYRDTPTEAVTPEMRSAGMDAYRENPPEPRSHGDLVEAIYTAMQAARSEIPDYSEGASPLATGLSQAEPEVSALRASIPSAQLTGAMLDRLRDSQAIPQPNGRVEVDCDALCDVLVAGHDAIGALKPFADALDEWGDEPEQSDQTTVWEHPLGMCVTLGDFRRAASAIEARSDATPQSGAAEGESAVGATSAETPEPSPVQDDDAEWDRHIKILRAWGTPTSEWAADTIERLASVGNQSLDR